MPIKFRCRYCKQFLGISRSRAGQAVDCPTCGRSVRVPTLDGKVKPLPQKPKLDLEDSKLASALDQLASIGKDDADDEPPDDLAASPEPEREVISVAPAANPKPVDPPAVAVPIPEPTAPPAAPTPSAATATAAPEPEQPSTIEEPPSEESLDRELEALAEPQAIPATPETVAVPSSASDGRATQIAAMQIAIGIVYGAVMFGAGYLAASRAAPEPPPNNAPDPAAAAPVGDDVPRQVLVAAAADPALKGRVTYKTESGESRPDRGARVIALPTERTGTARLTIVGFRASDVDADVEFALGALRSLGGDAGIVDEDGNYEVRLPAAGTYRVLLISRFQPASDDQPLAASERAIVGQWFDRPEQLLGQLSFHLDEFRYKGEGTEIRDHSFERP